MLRKWQFNLKGLLGVMAAIALPMAMVTSRVPWLQFWGLLLAVPITGGCLGFLAGGWGGVWPGVIIAVVLGLAATWLFIL